MNIEYWLDPHVWISHSVFLPALQGVNNKHYNEVLVYFRQKTLVPLTLNYRVTLWPHRGLGLIGLGNFLTSQLHSLIVSVPKVQFHFYCPMDHALELDILLRESSILRGLSDDKQISFLIAFVKCVGQSCTCSFFICCKESLRNLPMRKRVLPRTPVFVLHVLSITVARWSLPELRVLAISD